MNIEIIRKKNSHQIIAKVNDDYVLISESGPEYSTAISYPETSSRTWDALDIDNFRPILYVLVGETSVCFNCSNKR